MSFKYYKLDIRNSKVGFTILEVLLTLSIILIMSAISIPLYQSFQNRNDLDVAAITITQSLRRAQVLSRSVDGDTSWGLYIQSGGVTLFQGVSYAARDTNYDDDFVISSSMTLSGISEIVFTKFTGLPSTTGTITLTSLNNETRNIVVNDNGMVDY